MAVKVPLKRKNKKSARYIGEEREHWEGGDTRSCVCEAYHTRSPPVGADDIFIYLFTRLPFLLSIQK